MGRRSRHTSSGTVRTVQLVTKKKRSLDRTFSRWIAVVACNRHENRRTERV